MHSLTRKERANKKKGRMGSGWGKRKNKSPSKYIFARDRWLVVPPEDLKQGAMAFLSEEHAVRVATSIANNHNISVEIDHQVMNEKGDWVSVQE
jgi:hypothetical protein